MPPERRAVVFDLDDTIYPYRRFKLSGFAEVARHLERTCALDARLGRLMENVCRDRGVVNSDARFR